jgi:hypothetical protein
MLEETDRFEVVMEPTDLWIVWDRARQLPAEHAGMVLIGLAHSTAWMHCQLLNRLELSQGPPRVSLRSVAVYVDVGVDVGK